MRGCALRKVVRNLAHKNWKTGESNPSTSLHRSRDQRRPVGLRWAGGWQKNRAPREVQGRQVKNCRSHVGRQRRHRPVLIVGVHRCGTWPASASATASAASLDAAPGQHRYRHRQGQSPRPGACFGMAGVGASVVDSHRCGTWPASASASAASIDAAPGQHRYRHRQEPSTRRMPWRGGSCLFKSLYSRGAREFFIEEGLSHADSNSEVYCWRRRVFCRRMRATLGLACAQAATLCTQVAGQPRHRKLAQSTALTAQSLTAVTSTSHGAVLFCLMNNCTNTPRGKRRSGALISLAPPHPPP